MNYETARTTLKKALDSKNRIEEVRLAKELSDKFRAQYKEAARLAKERK